MLGWRVLINLHASLPVEQNSPQKGTDMSNPSYGPAGQPGAVPTNGTSYPGAAAPQGYAAPAPVVMPKLPGRGGAITTLVLGVVLMVIIAPIVFFATMVAGVAGTEGNSVKGGTTANGSVVTVTTDGVFMVQAGGGKDPSCSLIGADNKSYELEPYGGSQGAYLVEHVPAGSYVLHCDGIANGANITAFNASPEVVTKVFAMPFVWGTVVGVAGLIVLIVGIVLLVNVNGKRRRITQEAMLGAVR